MLERILSFSILHRWLVVLAVVGVAALGAYNYQRLPIDAVPDITNVQVQINSEAPGYAPIETEQRITFLVENALAGLPLLDYTRSISRYGLSQVTVVFEDGTDIYFARQLVNERIQEMKSKLPPTRRWGRSPPGSAKSSCSPSRPVRRERAALRHDGAMHDQRLGHKASTAQCPRRRRGQLNRRLHQAIPRHAAAGDAPRV